MDYWEMQKRVEAQLENLPIVQPVMLLADRDKRLEALDAAAEELSGIAWDLHTAFPLFMCWPMRPEPDALSVDVSDLREDALLLGEVLWSLSMIDSPPPIALADSSLRFVARLLIGLSNLSPHHEPHDLAEISGSVHFNIVSRGATEDDIVSRLRQINGLPILSYVLMLAVDPRNYLLAGMDAGPAIERLNGFLVYDGYRLEGSSKGLTVVALDAELAVAEAPDATTAVGVVDEPPASTEVFVVHGHDDGMKSSVARLIEKLGLNATILHEQPNRGQTILEKLEHHAATPSFAVVLLSADDVGGRNAEPPSLRPRARQNVIFEMGYVTGLVGRGRVVALYRSADGFEMPSDLHGLLYVDYDKADAWRLILAKEMKQAGLPVDLNTL